MNKDFVRTILSKRASFCPMCGAESQDRRLGESGLLSDSPAGGSLGNHYLGNSHHVCGMVKEKLGARRRAEAPSEELEMANKPVPPVEAKPNEGGFSRTIWRGARAGVIPGTAPRLSTKAHVQFY